MAYNSKNYVHNILGDSEPQTLPCLHLLISLKDHLLLLETCKFLNLNTITVMWERPLITGRDDYFYNIQYSNPDIPESFVQHNSNPLITTSPVVRYSLSGLRPQTRYTIRLSVLNGVSDRDSVGEEGRRSEVTATTGDISMHITSLFNLRGAHQKAVTRCQCMA